MSSPSLESSLVRILLDDQEPRRPVGAGFLVTPQHILTCAHVVNTVLDRNEYTINPPGAELLLDFPLLNDQALLRATILHWFPVADDSASGELEDIAVLELIPKTHLPAEARPAPLVVLPHEQSFFDWRVRMCGFPVGVDNGTYANGVLQGANAKGWIEIHHQGNELVEEGFSGTAVWSAEENAAVGMIVSVLNRQNAVVAYMIPAALLIKAFPEMERLSRPANPYRGLEAFREKDAKLYFGREQTITRVQQVIADQPFAAVIGASGSGKSSVVFAGLVPALRQSGDWRIAHCRPKNQPLYELAACLIPLLYDDPLMRSERTDVLHKKFSTQAITLPSLIRQIREKYEGQYFLLIVDQFEELFTLNPDTKLIRQYIDLLLECLHSEHFTVLCTMRADFFAAAVSHPALAQALDSYAPIILPQLDKEGLREAVEQPASSLGVRFADGLVDLIIRDVGQEPGSLPLLEFCLTQLWERQEFRQISHDAYKAIGGVQQALANHADAVYEEFAEEEREQLRHIFLKLVRPGQGTEDTRQVASVGQIDEEYRGLITRLADKRLLVTGRDEERGEETVEVVHEALIRRWQTLRQWVDEEREFLVWQEKLQVLLGQWEESGKDAGALLRGLPLDEALKWRGTHYVHLEDGEREFIEVSESAWKKQRRRKSIVVATGMLLAMVVLVTFFVLWKDAERQKIVADQERQHAVEQRGIAERKTAEATKQTLAANYNLAKVFEEKALSAQKKEHCKQAVLFASAALEQKIKQGKFALQVSSIGIIFAPEIFDAALKEQLLARHDAPVLSVSFSPDGRTLISASKDTTVRLWDIANGKEIEIFRGHEGSVNSVSFSPDGKIVASASADETVRLWDIASGKEIATFRGHEGSVFNVSFSPDGRMLASGAMDNTIRLWDIASGKESAVYEKEWMPVNSVSFSPDGSTVAAASDDNPVRLWDIASGKETAVFKGNKESFFSVSFSPDGSTVASASADRTVRLWDIASGKETAVFKGHEAWLFSVSFSPDGSTLASASEDNTVRLWDIASGKEIAAFRGHEGSVFSVSFSPDGRRLASASRDNTVLLWNIASDKETPVFRGQKGSFIRNFLSPDGSTLASASEDNTVRLWDIASGKEIAVLRGHEEGVRLVSFSPDGGTLAAASKDNYNTNSIESNTVRLWDIASGKEVAVFREHERTVYSMSFSPNGRMLVSGSEDGAVQLWDIASGKEIAVFRKHKGPVFSVSFSPNGRMLVSASLSGAVRLWDIASGKEIAVFRGHESRVKKVSFSPDGLILASASTDRTVRLWNIASGKEIAVLRGHVSRWVNHVSFSPDGSLIVSAADDKTVRVWDAESGEELIVFREPEGELFDSAVFGPDGRSIVSASSGNIVRIWDMRPYTLFLHNSKPTPLYQTFIEAVKFLWQLDVQGLEIVETERRTPADLKKYGILLAPPPPGQSKFDQVLEWAQQQQEK